MAPMIARAALLAVVAALCTAAMAESADALRKRAADFSLSPDVRADAARRLYAMSYPSAAARDNPAAHRRQARMPNGSVVWMYPVDQLGTWADGDGNRAHASPSDPTALEYETNVAARLSLISARLRGQSMSPSARAAMLVEESELRRQDETALSMQRTVAERERAEAIRRAAVTRRPPEASDSARTASSAQYYSDPTRRPEDAVVVTSRGRSERHVRGANDTYSTEPGAQSTAIVSGLAGVTVVHTDDEDASARLDSATKQSGIVLVNPSHHDLREAHELMGELVQRESVRRAEEHRSAGPDAIIDGNGQPVYVP